MTCWGIVSSKTLPWIVILILLPPLFCLRNVSRYPNREQPLSWTILAISERHSAVQVLYQQLWAKKWKMVFQKMGRTWNGKVLFNLFYVKPSNNVTFPDSGKLVLHKPNHENGEFVTLADVRHNVDCPFWSCLIDFHGCRCCFTIFTNVG